MKNIEFRANGTKKVSTINQIPTKTDQSFKDECDVNNIISKFNSTGQLTHLAKHQGQYADVSEIPDLHSAFQQVTQAQEAFSSLPAILRKKFANSPQNMIDFLNDPSNDDEAIKLGLKVKYNPTIPEESAGETPPKKQTKPKNAKNDDSNDE